MKQRRQRLDKVLSTSGFGSRKDVKRLIKDGAVTVNGDTVTDAGALVDAELDEITVSGERLDFKTNIYIMLNKPQGVISSSESNSSETVIDLLDGKYAHRNLFPVGRLDKDAEGLMLLSDDGEMAHRLLSPKNHVEKVYYIEAEGRLDERDVEAFKQGIELEDFTTQPAELVILEAGQVSKALVKIHEGKFHQVKRMIKACGKHVTYLKRLAIGPLKLDETLEPGKWRELTEDEIASLKQL